jgi:hypothetical protein
MRAAGHTGDDSGYDSDGMEIAGSSNGSRSAQLVGADAGPTNRA